MGKYFVKPTNLKVIKEDGVEVAPDMNVNVTDLNTVNNTLYKHFYNKGYGGITFTVNVIIHKSDYFMGYLTKKTKNKVTRKPHSIRVVTALTYFIKNMTPLSVVSKAIDVPNGTYIITANSSRKQSFPNYTIWSLEFTTYNPITTYVYKNNNARVLAALKQASKKQGNKNTKSSSTNNAKLGQGCLKQLVYSKNKKTNNCISLMQNVLYKKGFLTKAQVDGWFGPVTANAVKKFQQKYQKSYKLKVTGKVDSATLNCMMKV